MTYEKNLKELFSQVLAGTEVDSSMKKGVFDAIDFIKFMGEMTLNFTDTFSDAQINMIDTISPETDNDDKPTEHE